MKTITVRIIASMLAAVVGAGCASTSGNRPPFVGNSGQTGMVGGILLSESAAQATAPKAIVVSFDVTASGVTSKDALVTFGATKQTPSSGNDYRVELVASNARVVQAYSVESPRKAVVERQGIVENPSGVLVARFPFQADAAAVRVKDASGAVVAETAIAPVIREFCRRAPKDTDCAKVNAPG